MREIPVKHYGTGQEYQALVDDEDYEYLSQFTWRWIGAGYVARQVKRREDGKLKHGCVYMHREIVSAPTGSVVDHCNKNTLDNQKQNLRICSQRENVAAGRTMTAKNGKPVASRFRGVSRAANQKNPWAARIRQDGRTKSLGCFPTEREAALAYNAAALELHGDYATLNAIDD